MYKYGQNFHELFNYVNGTILSTEFNNISSGNIININSLDDIPFWLASIFAVAISILIEVGIILIAAGLCYVIPATCPYVVWITVTLFDVFLIAFLVEWELELAQMWTDPPGSYEKICIIFSQLNLF